MTHYDPEREKEQRQLDLEEKIARGRRRQRRLNKKGEAVFIGALLFIVVSIILLV